jgi:hypothetical protein
MDASATAHCTSGRKRGRSARSASATDSVARSRSRRELSLRDGHEEGPRRLPPARRFRVEAGIAKGPPEGGPSRSQPNNSGEITSRLQSASRLQRSGRAGSLTRQPHCDRRKRFQGHSRNRAGRSRESSDRRLHRLTHAHRPPHSRHSTNGRSDAVGSRLVPYFSLFR